MYVLCSFYVCGVRWRSQFGIYMRQKDAEFDAFLNYAAHLFLYPFKNLYSLVVA